jgi:hypothetical protein
MAASMYFMPPSTRISLVEKLLWRPAPFQSRHHVRNLSRNGKGWPSYLQGWAWGAPTPWRQTPQKFGAAGSEPLQHQVSNFESVMVLECSPLFSSRTGEID